MSQWFRSSTFGRFSCLDLAAWQNLNDLADGDMVFMLELLDAFLKDAPQMLAEISEAVKRKDLKKLRLAAHSLKSNSADFGAMTLSGLCRELEVMSQATEGDLAGATELVAQAQAAYEQAEVELQVVRRHLLAGGWLFGDD